MVRLLVTRADQVHHALNRRFYMTSIKETISENQMYICSLSLKNYSIEFDEKFRDYLSHLNRVKKIYQVLNQSVTCGCPSRSNYQVH